jgi:hypothetical protein
MCEEEYVLTSSDDKTKQYFVEKRTFATGSESAKKAHQDYKELCTVAEQKGYKIIDKKSIEEVPKIYSIGSKMPTKTNPNIDTSSGFGKLK